jgi:serine/threonine protein kinase
MTFYVVRSLTILATRAGSKEEGVTWIQGDAIRAPEIWEGASPNPACDIWSLGVSVSPLVLSPIWILIRLARSLDVLKDYVWYWG